MRRLLDSTVQFEVVTSNQTLESHLADCVVTFGGSSDSQSIRVRTAIRKASSEAQSGECKQKEHLKQASDPHDGD